MEWKFSPVQPIYRHGAPYKFNLSLSAFTLAEMFAKGVAEYVGEIQRGWKETKKGELKPVISAKHVKQILQAMLEDKMDGSTIILNYSLDNHGEINYRPEEQAISGTGSLQIVDGNHRINSCLRWVKLWKRSPENYPDPNQFYFPVGILNLQNDQAKEVFAEFCLKAKKISKTRGEFLNVSDVSNQIAREVMTNSELRGKVETVKTSIFKNDNKVVTFAVLTKGIRDHFKPATKSERLQLSAFLVEFFDYLIELFPQALGDVEVQVRKEIKAKSLVNELMTFPAYFALAKELQGRTDWKARLDKLRAEVRVGEWQGEFLSKQNPLWKSTILREGEKIINSAPTQRFLKKAMLSYIVNDLPMEEIKQIANAS